MACFLVACSGSLALPVAGPANADSRPEPGGTPIVLPTLFPTSALNQPTSVARQTPPAEPGLVRQSEASITPAVASTIANMRPGQHEYTLDSQNTNNRFLMYLPASFNANKKWPLILYLHSSIEKGSDLNLVRQRGLPKKLEDETDFPFIVISPQITDSYWYEHVETLENLLIALEKVLPIDIRREYLTGFSLGGYGTWAYAYHYPNRFAAIAPVAGSLDENETFLIPGNFCQMKEVAVWAFHGDLDENVNPEEDNALIQALARCGGEAKITLYSQVRHLMAAELAYAEPELFTWLLAHSK